MCMNVYKLISVVLLLIVNIKNCVACSNGTSNFNGYRIELNCNEEEGLYKLKIYKLSDNVPLFIEEGTIVSIYSTSTKKHKYGTIQNIARYVLVESYSGGAHCCWTYYLLDLSEQFKKLAKIDTYDSPMQIIGTKDKSGFLIYLYDYSYKYKWTSFASTPLPLVILSFNGSELIVAKQLMKKPPLTEDSFALKILHIKHAITEDFEYKKGQLSNDGKETAYLNILLSEVFDLIYSGNYSQAMRMIDKTWPNDDQSKRAFVQDISIAIRKSTYHDAILQINGLN